ncbi:excitatory amino acid transporter 2 isoform X2 [Hydra vulgaris]|uniref:Amino acid transporter n=1 Tax=Hydra vulgaris TaxID=6087 RepID=A0ABM4D7F2_HYDVU
MTSLHSNSLCSSKIKKFLKKNLLVLLIIFSAFTGVLVGVYINGPIQKLKQPDQYTALIILGFPGEILIRTLKMIILPLITCSLIVGLSTLDNRVSGKIGGRAVAYYLSTTVLAALLGVVLVAVIKPGKGMAHPEIKTQQDLVRPLDSFMDLIRNMFPSNIFRACLEQDKTLITIGYEVTKQNFTFDATNLTIKEINEMLSNNTISLQLNQNGSSTYTKNLVRSYKIGKGLVSNSATNYLGLIVFSIIVGKIANSLGKEAEPFVNFICAFNAIIAKMVSGIMWISPIGIGSLILAKFAEMSQVNETFSSLALFIGTVLAALLIHGIIVLPLIYFVVCRKNPYSYLKGMLSAMATAFGTASSAATLPITFRCLEDNLNVDKRITRFILPIGTTINMDGTALYEAISAIFIAQSIGRTLTFGEYAAISFTSVLASIGAAAIPHAGLVTMLIVLDTVGLPSDMIALIFSVDWFLDRIRTMINVLGDAYGAGIVEHLSEQDLNVEYSEEKDIGIDNEVDETMVSSF